MEGLIFDIQRSRLDDGPGIRTTVFLKGCPLRCVWCSNPESQRSSPEIMYNANLHIDGCEECIKTCPANAMEKDERQGIKISRDLCKVKCNECAKVCYSNALTVIGQRVSVEEVLKAVEKDIPFYRSSDGGVTISGGEPLAQPEFTREILKACKERGIHTVLDTSGYGQWSDLEKIIKYVDITLYDIKHMNPLKHKAYTGASNELILENVRRMGQKKMPIIIRLAIIPKINDLEENINELIELTKEVLALRVDLLPYHRLGVSKYKMLGREYRLDGLDPPTREHLKRIRDLLISRKVRAELVV
ncbi:glycyl-radical enzyme activating protein [Candidatus Bipolaricaulota bacterium]|nr:glycyl-radical enzyme activating protein [Candidatus Bipolaricaulota bacterium]